LALQLIVQLLRGILCSQGLLQLLVVMHLLLASVLA